VLLTLTTSHRPAADLGFLLVKHPDRVHTFELPFGTATVVFPEAGAERCTAVGSRPSTDDHDPGASGDQVDTTPNGGSIRS